MGKQSINVDELNKLKESLGDIKKNVNDNLVQIEGKFKKIFDENYWAGPKSESYQESLNTLWNPKEGNVKENINVDFDNLINFVTTVIAKVTGTDESVSENIEGSTKGEVNNKPKAENKEDTTEPSTAAPTTKPNTESDKKLDAAPPQKTENTGKSMDIPSGETSWKGYSNYREVTDKSTPAYAIVNGKTSPYGKYEGTTYNTKTDEETGVRYVTFKGDDTKYYCAALGTYYGEEGDTFRVTTDEGNTFNVIMCDSKGADAESYGNGKTYYHDKGKHGKEVVEFYIDYYSDDVKVYRDGKYIGTTGNYGDCDQFSGNVISIEKLS